MVTSQFDFTSESDLTTHLLSLSLFGLLQSAYRKCP